METLKNRHEIKLKNLPDIGMTDFPLETEDWEHGHGKSQ